MLTQTNRLTHLAHVAEGRWAGYQQNSKATVKDYLEAGAALTEAKDLLA